MMENEEKTMRKSIIAAIFGGVLASGFLTVSAPVASAAPGLPAFCNLPYYQLSWQQIQVCGPPTNGPAVGCDEAARQSGLPCINP
jgi:hypothetical protein